MKENSKVFQEIRGNKLSKPTFNVIDVETANANRSSICQIGIVCVTDGKITKEWESLIDPQDRFDQFNISIHGITPEAVMGARTMPEVHTNLRRQLNGQILVSHSSFDRGAMDGAMVRYKLPKLRVTWLDSCKIAQWAWPNQGDHKLDTVASHLGYKFQHHDALEDARAAAQIVLQALHEMGVGTFLELLQPAKSFDQAQGKVKGRIPSPGSDKLLGERVVFTGRLPIIRRQAKSLVIQAGGLFSQSVTSRTTMLVCGTKRIDDEKITPQHRRAMDLMSKGHKIRILTEREFFGIF